MKWIEAKVFFDPDREELAPDLVTDIFLDLGARGVVIEDPDLQPSDAWAEDAVWRPDRHAVGAYFPVDSRLPRRRAVLEKRLRRLRATHGIAWQAAYRQIEEEDWAESWKAYFWPQRISDRLVIKPTWREFEAGPEDIILEIDPGMAFGTGTHPTTALCLRMIEKYLGPGQRLLDVGTGSGILMVAAARLGAAYTVGVDSDLLAVETARRNLAQNRIDSSRFSLLTGSLSAPFSAGAKFDVVVANILSDVILRLLDDVGRLLSAGGLFICSGIVEGRQDAVIAKMEKVRLPPVDLALRETWVCIAGRPSGADGS
jgi:ribosomal protein L11 methyltransferase